MRLFAWRKFGYFAAQSRYELRRRECAGVQLRNVLRGKLAYLRMVRGENDFVYRRLVRSYNRLNRDAGKISVPPIEKALPCAMHNVRQAWEIWSARYSSEVFHLLFTNEHGDEAGASGFHIGGGRVATAQHIVFDDNRDVRRNLRVIDKPGEERAVRVTHTVESGHRPDVACVGLSDISARRGIPTQLRLPEIGEEVAALGFPRIPLREPTMVMDVGSVEALPVCYVTKQRFIQVGFQSGGGLSGGCLIDRSGHAVGIMVENVFMAPEGDGAVGRASGVVPSRPYGQAVPMEYLDDEIDSREELELDNLNRQP